MDDHNCKQEDKIQKLCEFKGSTESDITTLFNMVKDIKDNDLRHINTKINALLFTVLGSVFVTVVVMAVRFLTNGK